MRGLRFCPYSNVLNAIIALTNSNSNSTLHANGLARELPMISDENLRDNPSGGLGKSCREINLGSSERERSHLPEDLLRNVDADIRGKLEESGGDSENSRHVQTGVDWTNCHSRLITRGVPVLAIVEKVHLGEDMSEL
jgi:hypothetical protein